MCQNCHNTPFSVPPEWVSKPQDVLIVKEGSNVNIDCTARGEPESSVKIAKIQGRAHHLLILNLRLNQFAPSRPVRIRVAI